MNSRHVLAALLGLVVLIEMFLPGCRSDRTETIRIAGSTTMEPFMNKATADYAESRNVRFTINAIGSKSGIDSLITGNCDIAMSSAEVLPEQTVRAKNAGIHLKPFLLGYDIIVPIVHPSNTVTDIPFEKLKEVFEGKITRWSAFGGVDTSIDVVDRSDASGTYMVWHHYVAPVTVADEQVTVRQSNSSVLAYVSGHTNAIGYVSITYLNPEVKPLKLDGIAATEKDSILAGYQLKRPLYLLVNEDRFDERLKAFIIFLIVGVLFFLA